MTKTKSALKKSIFSPVEPTKKRSTSEWVGERKKQKGCWCCFGDLLFFYSYSQCICKVKPALRSLSISFTFFVCQSSNSVCHPRLIYHRYNDVDREESYKTEIILRHKEKTSSFMALLVFGFLLCSLRLLWQSQAALYRIPGNRG